MALLDEPHHDGRRLRRRPGADARRRPYAVRVRVPHAAARRRVRLRTTPDGEPRSSTPRSTVTNDGATWWRADVHLPTPSRRLPVPARRRPPRPLLGERRRRVRPRRHRRRRLPHSPPPRPPSWLADTVVYQIFPDRFARSGAAHADARWAIARDWDDAGRRHAGHPIATVVRRRPARHRRSTSTISFARRHADLPHPVLPGRFDPPLRRLDVRPRRPDARRRRCARLARRRLHTPAASA